MFFYDPRDLVILSSIFVDSFGYLADYPKISTLVCKDIQSRYSIVGIHL